MNTVAWGAQVAPGFKARVIEIAAELGCDPSHLMACMAFESGGTFSPSVRNAAGSGAVGLIQFMPATAAGLGTSTDALARMTPLAQLEYVRRHFLPFKGRLATLEDVYMTILWPAAVGRPAASVLFARESDRPKVYFQNRGLDLNKDGSITKAEAAAKVQAALVLGMKAGNIG